MCTPIGTTTSRQCASTQKRKDEFRENKATIQFVLCWRAPLSRIEYLPFNYILPAFHGQIAMGEWCERWRREWEKPFGSQEIDTQANIGVTTKHIYMKIIHWTLWNAWHLFLFLHSCLDVITNMAADDNFSVGIRNSYSYLLVIWRLLLF